MATEQAVRERAYHIWENEGRRLGQAEAHWLRAEAELRAASGPLVIAAVEAERAPSPKKVLKPAVRKTAKAGTKAVETVAAKPKRAPRAKAEHAGLH